LIATLVMDYGQYGGTPAERDVNQCIAALGAPAIDCLLDLLKDSGDRAQRRAILTLLKNQGNGILPQVQQRLEDPVWYFVRNLLHLLGELGQEESARLLIPLLNHGDHRVVKEALAGLGQIGSRNATPFIARLLLTEPALATKKHDEVRITAARTLARIGDQRALDTLRRGTFVRRPAVARVCEETLRDSSSRTAARGDGGGARR
jgi:HEAT repeat protein